MEVDLQAASPAPQAQVDVPQNPVDGQPSQVDVERPIDVEGQTAEQPQEEWFLKAETGTVYKTPEAAAAGIAEKDRLIERLLAERNRVPQEQPQPQVDPKAQAAQEIAELQRQFELEFRFDPRFQDASPEAIEEHAYIQAKATYFAEQRIMSKFQKELQQQSHMQFVQNTPDLQTPIAKEVYDRAIAQGTPFNTPQDHLNAVHAEMYRRGMSPQHPNQPQAGSVGVQGAMQQNANRPVFGNVAGRGGPSPETVPEHVQRAMDYAVQRGVTDPVELQRIKETAMGMDGRLVGR